METAFVIINTMLGQEIDVAKKLQKIKGVQEVHRLYGIYDIIVKLQAETMGSLKRATDYIRRTEDVRAVYALILVQQP